MFVQQSVGTEAYNTAVRNLRKNLENIHEKPEMELPEKKPIKGDFEQQIINAMNDQEDKVKAHMTEI